MELWRVTDRIICLKMELDGVMLNVISAYAPQVGCIREEKEAFWLDLDETVEKIPENERIVVGADLNGHEGEGNNGDEECMGRHGLGKRNNEGQAMVDFAKRMELAITNAYFVKKNSTQSHLQQWQRQFTGGLHYGEKKKNQRGGGYKGYCQ